MTPTWTDMLISRVARDRLVMDFAREFGFARPRIVAVRRDLRAPGTTALWVRDEAGVGLAGVLTNDHFGIVGEFDAQEFRPGKLPADGLRTLLLTGP